MTAAVKGKLSCQPPSSHLMWPLITRHYWLMRTIIHAAQNIYHHRDLFQRQDKWFPSRPPRLLTHLQTGGGHTDLKESEDASRHAQEGVPGHDRGQGGAGLGEVPRGQVPDGELHLRGGHQVQDSQGREPEQDGRRRQEGGGSGQGPRGWSEGTPGAASRPLQTATHSEEGRA